MLDRFSNHAGKRQATTQFNATCLWVRRTDNIDRRLADLSVFPGSRLLQHRKNFAMKHGSRKSFAINPILKYFDKSIGERMSTWLRGPGLPSTCGNNFRDRISATWYSRGGSGSGAAVQEKEGIRLRLFKQGLAAIPFKGAVREITGAVPKLSIFNLYPSPPSQELDRNKGGDLGLL